MSSKLIYICDICKRELNNDREWFNLDSDVFGLEQGNDICYECENEIMHYIERLKTAKQ